MSVGGPQGRGEARRKGVGELRLGFGEMGKGCEEKGYLIFCVYGIQVARKTENNFLKVL